MRSARKKPFFMEKRPFLQPLGTFRANAPVGCTVRVAVHNYTIAELGSACEIG